MRPPIAIILLTFDTLQTAEVVIGVQGLKLYEKAVTFKS
jgi:hypothetical protein